MSAKEASITITAAELGTGLAGGASLSKRVAAVLQDKISSGNFTPGTRLPTEAEMSKHFGVSRTVIREAIASLRAAGLVETRQGLGAFVRRPGNDGPFHSDPLTSRSITDLLGLIEVRRGMEAEVAALAAARHSDEQLAEIRRAKAEIDREVAAGGDGVEADVRFHLAIARATGNQYWVKLGEMFSHQLQAAVKVTRANEARRRDFAEAVRTEHDRIVEAIARRDAEAARAAAAEHMVQAARRVSAADQDFWSREGGEYARGLSEKS